MLKYHKLNPQHTLINQKMKSQPSPSETFLRYMESYQPVENIDEMHATIRENNTAIRALISQFSTLEVIGYCMNKSLTGSFPDPDLSSPTKQLFYLIGLLLQTDEPDNPNTFETEKWDKVTDLLQRLFNAYSALYAQGDIETSTILPRHQLAVASAAFSNYFFTTLIASMDQMRNHIKRQLTPHDRSISQHFGLSASEMLDIADYIADAFESQWQNVTTHYEALKSTFSVPPRAFSEMNSAFKELDNSNPLRGCAIRKFVKFKSTLDTLGTVKASDLGSEFGENGGRYWDLFVIGRGEGPELDYPTERSVAEIKPLIRLNSDTAMCFRGNSIYETIINQVEEFLVSGSERSRFFNTRARILEEDVASVFEDIGGRTCRVYRRVFETADDHDEHDAILLSDDLCLIIETKATPPKEPFRDVEKAFTRLKRAYNADTGLQRAYDQGIKMMKRLESESEVKLYNRKGQEVVTLTADVLKHMFVVCATGRNFAISYLSILVAGQSRS